LISFDFSRSKDDTKQKLKEITNMRLQLDRSFEESNEYRRKLDLNARDNKRLQDDHLTLQRENQVRRFTIIFNRLLLLFLDTSSRTSTRNWR
jgi:hypothetical protein